MRLRVRAYIAKHLSIYLAQLQERHGVQVWLNDDPIVTLSRNVEIYQGQHEDHYTNLVQDRKASGGPAQRRGAFGVGTGADRGHDSGQLKLRAHVQRLWPTLH